MQGVATSLLCHREPRRGVAIFLLCHREPRRGVAIFLLCHREPRKGVAISLLCHREPRRGVAISLQGDCFGPSALAMTNWLDAPKAFLCVASFPASATASPPSQRESQTRCSPPAST